MAGGAAAQAERAYSDEFAQLREELGEELGAAPLRLDYTPSNAEASMRAARERLSAALEEVAQDWWARQPVEWRCVLVAVPLSVMKRA